MPANEITRKTFLAGGAAAFVAVALSACSSGGAGSTDSGAAGGVTIVTAVSSNPAHFNRYLSTLSSTSQIGPGPIYEALLHQNSEYGPEPWLTTSWEISADGLTYTFHLRDGVKWHDGEPFTSADVKFTYEKFVPLHAFLGALTDRLSSIETPSDLTVVFHLREPFTAALAVAASATIMPKHAYTTGDVTTDPANIKAIGTGPLKLEEFVSGERVVLTANKDYWGENHIDRYVYQIIPELSQRMLALQTGEINYLYQYEMDLTRLGEFPEEKFTRLHKLGGQPTYTMWANTRIGALSTAEVRRALYQAINRDDIAKRGIGQGAVAARGPIPPGFSSMLDGKVDYSKQLPYNPKAAKAALEAAGYTAGNLSLRLSIMSGSGTDDAANLIKANLEEIGVKVEVVSQESNAFIENVFAKHDFDLAIMSLDSAEDPNMGVARVYVSNPKDRVSRNPSGYSDPAIDAAWNAAGSAVTKEERAQAFNKAETLALESMHAMPLASKTAISLVAHEIDMDAAHQTSWVSWGMVKKRG
jgi:peptide/nickel transport system substrate-binding protein